MAKEGIWTHDTYMGSGCAKFSWTPDPGTSPVSVGIYQDTPAGMGEGLYHFTCHYRLDYTGGPNPACNFYIKCGDNVVFTHEFIPSMGGRVVEGDIDTYVTLPSGGIRVKFYIEGGMFFEMMGPPYLGLIVDNVSLIGVIPPP